MLNERFLQNLVLSMNLAFEIFGDLGSNVSAGDSFEILRTAR